MQNLSSDTLQQRISKISLGRILVTSSLILLSLFYLFYTTFLIRSGVGPVDYDTFMDIGRRFLSGQDPYGPNSLYPMPFVGIFALFAWLPRPVSLALWFGGQVFSALAIGGPWVLAFAPTMAIQSSALGMIGLWGYRRNPDKPVGGLWLAVILLKPQLGLFPLIWAANRWRKCLQERRRLPAQFWTFLFSMSVFYLPWFLLNPHWVNDWLSNPRGLRERAMAGIIPRAIYYLELPSIFCWLLVAILASALLWVIRQYLNFDTFILWSFMISPIIHDYDLIQLIPIVREGSRLNELR